MTNTITSAINRRSAELVIARQQMYMIQDVGREKKGTFINLSQVANCGLPMRLTHRAGLFDFSR